LRLKKHNTSRVVELRVVKGSVANDCEHGALEAQFGFAESKWYAYKWIRSEVVPNVEFSPTAPISAFTKMFAECRFAQDEFTTKKDAVAFVESEWE